MELWQGGVNIYSGLINCEACKVSATQFNISINVYMYIFTANARKNTGDKTQMVLLQKIHFFIVSLEYFGSLCQTFFLWGIASTLPLTQYFLIRKWKNYKKKYIISTWYCFYVFITYLMGSFHVFTKLILRQYFWSGQSVLHWGQDSQLCLC